MRRACYRTGTARRAALVGLAGDPSDILNEAGWAKDLRFDVLLAD